MLTQTINKETIETSLTNWKKREPLHAASNKESKYLFLGFSGTVKEFREYLASLQV